MKESLGTASNQALRTAAHGGSRVPPAEAAWALLRPLQATLHGTHSCGTHGGPERVSRLRVRKNSRNDTSVSCARSLLRHRPLSVQ